MAILPAVIQRPGRPAALLALALLALLLLLALPPAGAQQTTDYDMDDDGLIEIATPQQLNAIRHDINGDGLQGSVIANDWAVHTAAFPNPATGQCDDPATTGATETCTGYELTTDLNLAADYPSWAPLATFSAGYDAVFDGNGYAISGVNFNGTGSAGLFLRLAANARIRNVGVIAPNITSATVNVRIGGLAGLTNEGSVIETSYVRGGTMTLAAHQMRGGGMVGRLQGTIRASYVIGTTVRTAASCCNDARTGSLVGFSDGGDIIASYAAGPNLATGGGNPRIGGLVGMIEVGANPAVITDSYCDTRATRQNDCIGDQSGVSLTSEGYTTSQLKQPTGYDGIYRDWNLDLDGDPMTDDDPWDFGSPRTYPLLKIDKDGDGEATCEEFSGQPCYREPSPPPYNPQADHPEIYNNPRHEMAVSCELQTTGEGDEALTTSTITFDLGAYTRPITLALSLWDGTHFRSLQSQGITMPELRQDGQMATVEVVTDPAQTRFRLDSQYGLNLVLGYADCHTDDP